MANLSTGQPTTCEATTSLCCSCRLTLARAPATSNFQRLCSRAGTISEPSKGYLQALAHVGTPDHFNIWLTFMRSTYKAVASGEKRKTLDDEAVMAKKFTLRNVNNTHLYLPKNLPRCSLYIWTGYQTSNNCGNPKTIIMITKTCIKIIPQAKFSCLHICLVERYKTARVFFFHRSIVNGPNGSCN